MNKLVKITAATGLALTLGVSTLAPVVTHAASAEGSIVYQDAYKTIKEFNKVDLEQLTGIKLTAANVDKVYNKLTQTGTWVKAGYAKAKAQEIAQRVSAYTYQLKGILSDIAYSSNKGLKVTYVSNAWTTQVNFGSYGYGSSNNEGNENGGTVTPDPGEEVGNGNEGEVVAPSTGVLAVKDLEIEIEYKKGDVEIDYQVKKDGKVEAKYENELTGEKLKGAKAQVAIENLFAGFNMQSKNQNQIVKHVLNKLNLKNDFKEFKYEVEFPNKAEFEFKIK
ncbi:hypothetical protein MFLO_03053 [Listeria floridensis FSL S10-1187]|uniref:Uncharacterized protein n=1 Tax=Listeria floridensis FSL S10-1187 TaxID=1265817 RepID=A0ABN0RHZ4_9LIST|nr:YusW family protein [Listeria floridensis]EUJ33487.1 hypothetical protein MFLO_03053 [Listeria floridensis FSL S10-1187]